EPDPPPGRRATRRCPKYVALRDFCSLSTLIVSDAGAWYPGLRGRLWASRRPPEPAPGNAGEGSCAMSRARFTKVYVGDLRVPMREILLSNGERVRLYDTSGPYTGPSVTTDVTRGLPPLRAEWIRARGDVAEYDGRPVSPADDGRADGPGP